MKTLALLLSLLVLLPACCHVGSVRPPASLTSSDHPTLLVSRSDDGPMSVSPPPPHHVVLGEIDDDSADAAISAMAAVDGPFLLEINSPGGSVPAGFKIAKAIEHRGQVVCVVDGEAASMAGYVLESCQVRLMTRRSSIMIHQPSLGGLFVGQPNDWQSRADELRALWLGMCEHMSLRTRVTAKTVQEHTAGGAMWWLAANESAKLRFVDGLVDRVEQIPIR